MKSKVVEDADVVTYVVVCDPGDEAVAALTQFAGHRTWRTPAAPWTRLPGSGPSVRPRGPTHRHG
jgi:hypothetical protein